MSPAPDPFAARDTLEAGGRSHVIFRIDAVREDLARTPYTVKVLLENVLRNVGRGFVTEDDVRALAAWRPNSGSAAEVPFLPARVVMQDFTGVPCVVDLAAMRDAMSALGRRPEPDQPAGPGGPGHRPLRAGRPLRRPRRLRRQRGARVRAQPGALHAPAVGAAGVPRLPRRPAGHRHRAPGQPRVPVAGRAGARGRRRAAGLPRHPGRHRLAHHDDQRRRRARLRRRRHRGRGRPAGPAAVAAHAPP